MTQKNKSKLWNKIILAVCFILILGWTTGNTKEETTMAIETDGVGVKNIKWVSPSGAVGLTVKSVRLVVIPDDFGSAYDLFLISDGTGTDTDELFDIPTQVTTGKFGVVAHFSTTNGIWITSSAVLVTGTMNHIVVTYDGGLTTNDPILYLNGSPVAITEISTPVGTYQTGTNTDIYLGSTTSGANLDGKTSSPLVYNRILSASEILSDYSARKMISIYSGLVFAPNLLTNGTSRDRITGVTGTFNGNPLFAPESVLSYGGL